MELRRGGGGGRETRHTAPRQRERETGRWEKEEEVRWMWVSDQR